MKSKDAIFYTDGACSGNPGVGGWAYVELVPCDCGYKTHIVSGSKEPTTNNEMELTAAYMALVRAYKNGCKSVRIFSDSAYVCNAISKGWLLNWFKNGWETKEGTPVKNKHIWEKMYKLVYGKQIIITMVQVKGHGGDPLNELADVAAVKAKNEL